MKQTVFDTPEVLQARLIKNEQDKFEAVIQDIFHALETKWDGTNTVQVKMTTSINSFTQARIIDEGAKSGWTIEFYRIGHEDGVIKIRKTCYNGMMDQRD